MAGRRHWTLLTVRLVGVTVSSADRLDQIARDADLNGSVMVTKAGATVLSARYGRTKTGRP